MKHYPEYKESYVKWIGEIPQDWEVLKTKHVGLSNPSKNNPKTTYLKDEPIVRFLSCPFHRYKYLIYITQYINTIRAIHRNFRSLSQPIAAFRYIFAPDPKKRSETQ